jgi:hypothetical protein
VNAVDHVRETLLNEWLPNIYKTKVRSDRTRAYKLDIPRRENRPEIQYTLLGIELKVGRKRFACPDLATARYLRVFARLGCSEFAIPYDITRISGVADELETSWQRILLVLEKEGLADSYSKVIKAIRDEVNEIGPGEAMPLFDRETRQRKA